MKITKQQLKQIIKEELQEARLPAWERPGYVPEPGYEPEDKISYVPQLMDDVALDIAKVLEKPEYARLDFGNFEIADQIAKSLEQVARDIRDNARTRS